MFNKFCRRLLRVIIYNSIIKGVISWFVVRNIYLVFTPVSGTELLNLQNFLSNESYKGVSGYMNNVTSVSHVRMGASCQEDQPGDWKVGTFNPTLSPTSGRERREVESISKDQWFNQPYLCNEATTKVQRMISRASRLVNSWRYKESSTSRERGHSMSFPHSLPCVSFPSGYS